MRIGWLGLAFLGLACLGLALLALPGLAVAQSSGRQHVMFSASKLPVATPSPTPVTTTPATPSGRYRATFPAPKPLGGTTNRDNLTPMASPTPVEVKVTGGVVRGRATGADAIFMGVPFAAPPVGPLRWAPPQDPTPWTGVRQTTESAPACLQNDYGWQSAKAAASSEDCLYLELRTPSLDISARKPVIVWLHGGANRAGDGSGTIFSGFAAKGVVIVSVQYRLGVFGFLSHPALTKEGGGASGNYALMDQIKALQWVQANIAQFGGDPYNVTLVGHSAGAQDVGLLLSSPLARGLFHKAILESGTPQFGFAPRTLAQNEAMGTDLARGFVTGGHKPGSAAALADLRAADTGELLLAGEKLTGPMEDQGFIWDQATIDGRVLPRSPRDILAAGEAAKVPVLIGVSAQELTLADISNDFDKAVAARFGKDAAKVSAMVDAPDPLLGDRVMRLSSDIMLRCPADWVAARLSDAGGKVWLYQLDVDRDGRIHHGSELNFVMNPRPQGLTDAGWPPLLDTWVAFARTGTPNGKGLATWPDYGLGRRYLEYTTSGPKVRDHIRADICNLLDRP